MTSATTTVTPGTYRIDTARSAVRFTARHGFGLGPVPGTFTVRDGTVQVDGEPRRSRVSATMDTASFRTDKPKRDTDIRGKRFLDTGRYPDMTFVSTALDGDTLDGELTVHGVTAPVSLTVTTPVATADGWTCRATGRIDRYAFGVTAGKGIIARYLDVEIELTATR
jgi:polyisoprenoid-binding protein YceI